MILGEARVPLFDFVSSLSKVMDLMSPKVVNHQLQVAYIAHSLATELDLPMAQRQDLALAGALHDIGAFSVKERLDMLQFEGENPHFHAKVGCELLRMFRPLADVAESVRGHHVPWQFGAGESFEGRPLPFASHVLHLADRISTFCQGNLPSRLKWDEARERIGMGAGRQFMPELVEAFESLAGREYFWLEMGSPALESLLRRRVGWRSLELGMPQLTELARMLCRLIDFRSEFTATHSSGVAATAAALARWAGFSEPECRLMSVAAYLHDLGKLAIPIEILEKPGKLDGRERDIMRSHAFYTYHILEPIEGLDVVTTWGCMHQERLNGSGYPFHRMGSELPLGARVMAVADVFTALTEDRPYRTGMAKDETLGLLNRMVLDSELDGAIVSLLERGYDEINEARAGAQQQAVQEYQAFLEAVA